MYQKIKYRKIENLLDYTFAFVLIYFTRSMWSTIPAIHSVNIILYGLMVATTVARLISSKSIKKIRFVGIVIITLYLFLFSIIRPINIDDYIRICITTSLTVLYISIPSRNGHNGENVLLAYERIILFITFLSLILWLAGPIAGILKPSGIVETSWSGSDALKEVNTYYYLYFTPQEGNLFSLKGLTRNTSIFVEAPVCSYHLCIALMIELFVKTKHNKLSVFVLCIGIVSSISMTGYAIAVLAISLHVFFSKDDRSIWRIIRIVILPIATLSVVIVLYNILQQRIWTGSGNTRIDDFVAGFKAWNENILFGNGYGNALSYIKYMSSFRYFNKGFSNSPMQILAYGGLYLFFPYFLSFIIGLFHSIKHRKTLFFFMLFSGMLVVTVLPFQPLTIFVMLYFVLSNKSYTILSTAGNCYGIKLIEKRIKYGE